MPSSILMLPVLLIGLATPEPAPAQASAQYRRAADVFELLDNVSDWWPGYTDAQYREHWVRHVGLTVADDTILASYAALRTRHFSKTGRSVRAGTPNRR